MNDQAAARNDDATSADAVGTDQTSVAKEGKTPKAKLVRDSFTIPKAEYTTLNELRQRSTRLAQPAKKSEILRAGIELLKSLSDQAFLDALAAVPNLKTGRPKKDGEEDGDAPAVKTGRKIIDKIAKRPARKTAAKAGEAGTGRPAKTLAEKSSRAVKRAAAGGKAKGGKAGKAGKAANKAGKPQRANRPAREDEADEV